jgi:hypothetical protein
VFFFVHAHAHAHTLRSLPPSSFPVSFSPSRRSVSPLVSHFFCSFSPASGKSPSISAKNRWIGDLNRRRSRRPQHSTHDKPPASLWTFSTSLFFFCLFCLILVGRRPLLATPQSVPLVPFATLSFLTFFFCHVGFSSTCPFSLSLVLSPPRLALPPPQIKKNTAPHELKPSDILIDRFTAWKQIVKMLIGESLAVWFPRGGVG